MTRMNMMGCVRRRAVIARGSVSDELGWFCKQGHYIIVGYFGTCPVCGETKQGGGQVK